MVDNNSTWNMHTIEINPLDRLWTPSSCWPVEDVSDEREALRARRKRWVTRAEALNQALENVECRKHRENSDDSSVVHVDLDVRERRLDVE
jgi:hypothetical protein